MTRRIILAGVLGGLALFLWEAIAHEALPLGEAGLSTTLNEAPVIAALKSNIPEAGFYMMPAPVGQPGLTPEQKRAAEEKMMQLWQTGPSAMVIFHPNGVPFNFGKMLALQYFYDVLAMLLAAALLARMRPASFAMRVIPVAAMGFLPSLQAEFPLWNWYDFPTTWVLAQATVHVVGFIVGGVVLSAIVKRPHREEPSELAAAA